MRTSASMRKASSRKMSIKKADDIYKEVNLEVNLGDIDNKEDVSILFTWSCMQK